MPSEPSTNNCWLIQFWVLLAGITTFSFAEQQNLYKVLDEFARLEDLGFYHPQPLLMSNRHARSIEGAPCVHSALVEKTNNKTDNATQTQTDACAAYPYTYCSPHTGQCVCNSKRAVRLELLPGYTFCLPIQYAIDTQRCLPTEPDICSLAYPGSKCIFQRDASRTAKLAAHTRAKNSGNNDNNNVVVLSQRQDTSSLVAGNGEWRCQCAVGGELNSCKLFVGMSCTNNASVCTGIGQQPGQPPTVECNSTTETDLYATCVCSLGTERSRDRLQCRARQCPRQGTTTPQPSPCRGSAYECYSPGQPQYVLGSGRFFCSCRDVGVSHSENVDGLCCPIGSLPCADFSSCVNQTSLCNGIKDCDDCSDEELRICARPLPNDASCSRPTLPLGRSQFGPLSTTLASDPIASSIPPFLQTSSDNNNVIDQRNNLVNPVDAPKTTPANRRDYSNMYDSAISQNGNSILVPKLDGPAQEFVQAAAYKEVNPGTPST